MTQQIFKCTTCRVVPVRLPSGQCIGCQIKSGGDPRTVQHPAVRQSQPEAETVTVTADADGVVEEKPKRVRQKVKGVVEQMVMAGMAGVRPEHPPHPGKIVMVGDREVMVGSSRWIGEEMQDWATMIVPLNGQIPQHFRQGEMLPKVFWFELEDFGGVPEDWETVVRWLWLQVERGERVGFWCTGGHGRTGTMLASLIAVAEPTVDPIKEARARGCDHMVETMKQVQGVAGLMSKEAGKRLREEWEGKMRC